MYHQTLSSRLRNPRLWVLAALTTLGLAGTWAFVGCFIRLDNLGMAVLKAGKPMPYPSTDWVDWQDTPQGVVAVSVLPPVADNPRLGNNYVQPGDRLLKIDYLPVYQSEVVRQLSGHAGTGTVLLYQLERPDPGQFGLQRINQFVVLGYRPAFSFTESAPLWWAHLITELLALLATLLLLALVAPFFRTNLAATLPIVLLLIAGALYFGLTVARYLALRLDPAFEHLNLELTTALASGAQYVVLGLVAAATAVGWWRAFVLIPSLGIGAILLAALYYAQRATAGFGHYASVIQYGLQAFLLLHLLAYLGLSLTSDQFRFRHAIRLGLWAGTGLLAAAYLYRVVQAMGDDLPQTDQTLDVLLRLAPALPLAVSASTALRFGNVSTVAVRGVVYLTGGLLLFGVFMFTERLTERLAIGGFYRGALEFGLLIGVILLVRALLIRNQKGLGQFIATAQQRRAEVFNDFIARMPRFTQSRQLVLEASRQTAIFLQADRCRVWPAPPPEPTQATESETNALPVAPAEDELLPTDVSSALRAALMTHDNLWSRTKELAASSFEPALEAGLEAAGVQLLIPLRNGPEPIALLVSRKRGVYNLSQIEALEPMRRQCRLTLEILDLLEKEKALVKQTLEANLRALRSQVNPHFLFNALNTIAALVHDDPDLAEEAIVKLSTIFRYTLKHSHLNFVRLDQELQLVRNYLEIEELRFGERLELTLDVDPTCHPHLIPAFMLQTLVENALKHGVAKMVGTGRVGLSVQHQGADVVCVITDNGPGIDLSRVAQGTGTSNTRERLQTLYKRDDLVTFENTGHGTRVTLRLPPAPPDAVTL